MAEKPSQGMDIAAALLGAGEATSGQVGADHVRVIWAEGHLLEMVEPDGIRPEWGQPWRADALPMIPSGGQGIPQRPRGGGQQRVRQIADEMLRATEVVNACDAGREGELIFDEIVRYAGLNQSGATPSFSRMWITDTRPEALRVAFDKRARATLVRLERAREASWTRAEVDWLWGYNLTRYATLGLRTKEMPLLVVGRVQTPVLGEIVTVDREIALFEPEPFEKAPVVFTGQSGNRFVAHLVAFPHLRFGHTDIHFHPGPEIREIRNTLMVGQDEPWKVMDMPEQKQEHPPPPFSLIDLQRSSFRIYGWPAAYTLELAQKLYAKERAITYPRTESASLPVAMRDQVEGMRHDLYYGWALRRFPELKEAVMPTDEAHWSEEGMEHHAIVPTGIIPETWDQNRRLRDDFLLWELIAVRTILAWLPPAKVAAVKRTLMRSWDKDTVIRAFVEAEPVYDPGWLWWEDKMMNTRGYGKALNDRMQEVAMPDAGPLAKLSNISITQGKTTCPDPHDEESILGWMSKKRLGTAATRANIIEELLNRGYLVRSDRGTLRSTQRGSLLIGVLETRTGAELSGDEFPRQIEEMVERMAGMAKERPTRERVWSAIEGRIRAIGAKLVLKQTGGDEAFCPRTGIKAELHSSGKYFVFAGFKDARCWLTIKERKMSASEYAAILAAGDRGAGPFEGFRSSQGTDFDAHLVWRPKKHRFELLFKR